jgi:hypothetical protein
MGTIQEKLNLISANFHPLIHYNQDNSFYQKNVKNRKIKDIKFNEKFFFLKSIQILN